MIEREPSEQTLRACDAYRQKIADVKGTTRNAIDQLIAGNTHDPYVSFRKLFQEAAWAGADIHHWLDDLHGIASATSQVSGERSIAGEMRKTIQHDSELMTAMVDAIDDGMNELEARALLKIVPKFIATLERISEIAAKGVCESLPNNARAFAREAVSKRRAA